MVFQEGQKLGRIYKIREITSLDPDCFCLDPVLRTIVHGTVNWDMRNGTEIRVETGQVERMTAGE